MRTLQVAVEWVVFMCNFAYVLRACGSGNVVMTVENLKMIHEKTGPEERWWIP